MRSALFALVLSLSSTLPVFGHEFWISPHDYEITTGKAILADIRVGQNFAGSVYSYIPQNIVTFEMVGENAILPVEGRIGDRPALNFVPPSDGLWIVVHETTDNELTYRAWEKFAAFVKHKKLANTLERHDERRLAKTGFKESYRRYAKSLVAVGEGQGHDRAIGLLTEIVVEENPYTGDVSKGVPVRVLYDGAPRVNAQVEIFEKSPSGDVDVSTADTDKFGRVTVAVKPGHEYLLDAVKMLEVDTSDSQVGPVWRSLWASTTFAIPD